jgi:hypothetical protein
MPFKKKENESLVDAIDRIRRALNAQVARIIGASNDVRRHAEGVITAINIKTVDFVKVFDQQISKTTKAMDAGLADTIGRTIVILDGVNKRLSDTNERLQILELTEHQHFTDGTIRSFGAEAVKEKGIEETELINKLHHRIMELEGELQQQRKVFEEKPFHQSLRQELHRRSIEDMIDRACKAGWKIQVQRKSPLAISSRSKEPYFWVEVDLIEAIRSLYPEYYARDPKESTHLGDYVPPPPVERQETDGLGGQPFPRNLDDPKDIASQCARPMTEEELKRAAVPGSRTEISLPPAPAGYTTYSPQPQKKKWVQKLITRWKEYFG